MGSQPVECIATGWEPILRILHSCRTPNDTRGNCNKLGGTSLSPGEGRGVTDLNHAHRQGSGTCHPERMMSHFDQLTGIYLKRSAMRRLT